MTTKFNVGDTVLVEGTVESIYVETINNEPVYKLRIKGTGAYEAHYIRVNEDVMKTVNNAPTIEEREVSEREPLKPTKDLINDIVGFDISGLIESLPEFKFKEDEDT